MHKKILALLALTACLVATLPQAHATLPTLILKNQFGEESINRVLGGTGSLSTAIAANSVLSNLTGSSAAPIANTYAAVSAKLTPAMLLTGFVSGAGAVAGTDTVLQAVQKVAGNTQNKALLSFTSSAGAGGAATEAMVLTGLLSTDTIIAVTQKTKGANSLPLLGYTTQATNALTAVWSADPGANAVIVVTVLR